GLPGRDEHWLVHFIELVLDVPRKFDVPGKLDVPGSSTLLGGGSGGCLGGTSTGSSISSSWCSTFPGNATRKLDAPRWYRSVKQSEGHAAPDRALGMLLFPLGCADVLGQGAAGILVLLLHLPLHLCLAVHRRRGQCLVQQAGGHGLEPARILLCRLHMVTELAILQARVIGVVGL